jgi:hypothetical protein
MRKSEGGDDLIEIYCKHICKCQNVSPIQLLFANKNIKRKGREGRE